MRTFEQILHSWNSLRTHSNCKEDCRSKKLVSNSTTLGACGKLEARVCKDLCDITTSWINGAVGQVATGDLCHTFHSIFLGVINHFISSDALQFLNLLILSNQIYCLHSNPKKFCQRPVWLRGILSRTRTGCIHNNMNHKNCRQHLDSLK